jgi:hypothetical protein
MNPNYIKECTKIVGEHNKLENVKAIGMNQSQRFNPKG